MSKFSLIESMGLKVIYNYDSDDDFYFVKADDIEKALQAAPVVYSGKKENLTDQEWDDMKMSNSTHTARVVCIQPLKKQTKTEAALEFVNKLADPIPGLRFFDLLNEAKNISEMKD